MMEIQRQAASDNSLRTLRDISSLYTQAFFSKWDILLSKEEKDMVRLRRELWTTESSEREKTGRCFGGLVIDPGSFFEAVEAPKINRYTYRFMKQKRTPTFSFTVLN